MTSILSHSSLLSLCCHYNLLCCFICPLQLGSMKFDPSVYAPKPRPVSSMTLEQKQKSKQAVVPDSASYTPLSIGSSLCVLLTSTYASTSILPFPQTTCAKRLRTGATTRPYSVVSSCFLSFLHTFFSCIVNSASWPVWKERSLCLVSSKPYILSAGNLLSICSNYNLPAHFMYLLQIGNIQLHPSVYLPRSTQISSITLEQT